MFSWGFFLVLFQVEFRALQTFTAVYIFNMDAQEGLKQHRSFRQALRDATGISLGQRRLTRLNEERARQPLPLIHMRGAYRLVWFQWV